MGARGRCKHAGRTPAATVCDAYFFSSGAVAGAGGGATVPLAVLLLVLLPLAVVPLSPGAGAALVLLIPPPLAVVGMAVDEVAVELMSLLVFVPSALQAAAAIAITPIRPRLRKLLFIINSFGR